MFYGWQKSPNQFLNLGNIFKIRNTLYINTGKQLTSVSLTVCQRQNWFLTIHVLIYLGWYLMIAIACLEDHQRICCSHFGGGFHIWYRWEESDK